ncbi:hypothetical protein HBI56_110360 [Parastagonospora nodorum]|nr:hypothetical protein HBH51_048730 [Parastagonospora nodorum]KAH4207482.1 hypothetical protein HBI95_104710 [Parastagonospora nodorum]KAH4349989.1 hypothetical protein HBH98_059420 [Parastagonospora nodorum]KAH4395059.1 hypothetical protein HBH97_027240 [Parastagonospora nodorum]KAH4415279.1 hypothetical protein HBH92_075780 [Parastagonospora nodorum]
MHTTCSRIYEPMKVLSHDRHTAITELAQEHVTEIEKLKQKHANDFGLLSRQHAQKMVAVKAKSETRLEELLKKDEEISRLDHELLIKTEELALKSDLLERCKAFIVATVETERKVQVLPGETETALESSSRAQEDASSSEESVSSDNSETSSIYSEETGWGLDENKKAIIRALDEEIFAYTESREEQKSMQSSGYPSERRRLKSLKSACAKHRGSLKIRFDNFRQKKVILEVHSDHERVATETEKYQKMILKEMEALLLWLDKVMADAVARDLEVVEGMETTVVRYSKERKVRVDAMFKLSDLLDVRKYLAWEQGYYD